MLSVGAEVRWLDSKGRRLSVASCIRDREFILPLGRSQPLPQLGLYLWTRRRLSPQQGLQLLGASTTVTIARLLPLGAAMTVTPV